MKDRQESKVPKPAKPDPDNNLGRGAPFDREERIRQLTRWEQEGRLEGEAQRHWDRAAEDLGREDAEIQRKGIAGEKRVSVPPAMLSTLATKVG
jgi:hypothetical protein